jgi:addiction module HigA family antidote
MELNMKKISNIHPGEILKEEFLIPFNITAYRLAKDTNIPPTRISQIIKGKRSITADTALRFSKYFGTTPDFWLGLQIEYDLREESVIKEKDIKAIKSLRVVRTV